MCAYVIGVVRSASCLDTLTYEASDPADDLQPWKRTQTCELRPLAPSSRPELWSAWRALESVTEWGDATLGHVLAILRETVPSAEVASDLPALGPEVQPPPQPRATAAHPRAFRGTKYRPPKPRRPASVDVRPYLLTRRHVDHVMEQLGQPRGTDPYIAWNHGVTASGAFDPAFVMHLLPLLRGCTWSDVGAFAALARTLELHARPELRAALVGVYLAAGDPTRALGWWGHVLAQDADQRLEAAQLVSASGIATLPPLEPAFATEVAQLPAVQQWSICHGLAGGAAPAYIASGLQLGALASAKIEAVAPGRDNVTSIVEATIERLGEATEEDSGPEFWRAHLWRLCGYQPELIELIGSPDFASLRPEAAFGLVRTASTPRWEPETADERWRELAPKLRLIVELATRVAPEYQRKLVEDLIDVYWWAVHAEHDITDVFTKCADLCVRVARPPFATNAAIGSITPSMALVYADAEYGPERRAIRDAPDSSWLALESACKRMNQVRLVGRGLNRLAQLVPKLVASTFATAPGALLQTADAVAALSFENAAELLDAYTASPLADARLVDAPIEELCKIIEPVAQAGGPNPVRRALREHFSGEKLLTDERLRRHRERIVADLGIVRLAAIRQSVERALAARVGIETIGAPNVRHALAMLTQVDIHRRQLRRMLTAILAGDADWRRRHPLTNAWFARHPKVDADTWLGGIETCGEIAGIGEVRLAVERDPLEALKLGTYVGSCLGRGGNFEYSAAAVVLDANKQVVYARDARGSVVGRQLVVISEAEQLVCFSVYGTAKLDALQPLFRDYDRRFAATLGLPLFGATEADCSYKVASILSHAWWDDTAWDGEP